MSVSNGLKLIKLLVTCFRGWILLLLMCVPYSGYAQFGLLDVKMSNNVLTYKKLEIPGSIISVRTLPSGIVFQWESSLSPLSDFVSVSGATSANYAFVQPLQSTTYFRRRATLNSGTPNQMIVYSNTIRIKVVPNDWEDVPYVRQHDVLVSGVTSVAAVEALPTGEKIQTTNFIDGFGRMTQNVVKGVVSPSAEGSDWGDLVAFATYDAYGKVIKEHLPYPAFPETGKKKSSPVTQQELFYSNTFGEPSPYDAIGYDNSPENRIINVKSPGASGAAGSGNQVIHDINGVDDEVVLWKISTAAGAIPVKFGNYPANTLFKKITIDEEGKKFIEYTNISGQQILVKTQLDDQPTAGHTGWICTYNIYDNFGLLRYQLQPEAVKWLQQNAWNFSATGGATVLGELCFAYDYDERGRNTYKKIAGAAAMYMLYDLRGRLVFTQDGNQRAKPVPEWMAYLYDALDRNLESYLYKTAKTVQQLQTDIQNAQVTTTVVESDPSSPLVNLEVSTRVGGGALYTAKHSIEFLPGFESSVNDAFIAEIDPGIAAPATSYAYTTVGSPVSSTDLSNPAVCTLLKSNFYDHHAFPGNRLFDHGFNNLSAGVAGEPIQAGSRTTGLLTGTKVRVLGTDHFLITTIYYDEKGRIVQAARENIKGGFDIRTNQYAFDGRLLTSDERHTAANTAFSNFSTITKNSFDRIGRLTAIDKKFGTNSFRTILSVGYDEFGRIKWKKLDPGYIGAGKQELETLVYSYNIHGEITGVNKDYALKTSGQYNKWGNFFGFCLGYENTNGLFTQAKLNGKVAGVIWNTQGDDAQRRYDFGYDNAGRLINASFSEKKTASASWSNAELDFSVSGQGGKINYDLNGNLLSMIHKGVLPGQTSPIEVDNLVYAYASLSNKLVRVTDQGGLGTANGGLGDFKDGNNTGQDDYLYDANGNLIADLNKLVKGAGGGAGISYNFMDKPEEIRIEGKGMLKIVYDADGNRLQRIYTPTGGSAVTTSYAGAFVYRGDVLQFINFEEGRIRIVEAVSQTNGLDFLQLDGNLDIPGGKRGAFDYFIRDYQDNVRMVLTEEVHTGSNICTNEPDRADIEEPLFGEVNESGVPTASNEVKARFNVSGIPGQSVNNGWQHTGIGNYVSRVGNLAFSKVGPNSLLKVMAGDVLSATSIYYYKNPVVNTSGATTLTTSILQSLVQAITGSPVVAPEAKAGAASIGTALAASSLFTAAIAPDAGNSSGAQPKAYLSMVFFDERFNVVGEGTESVRVTQSGNGAAPLVLSDIRAPKNGYVYIYLSNESDEHVYFDNFQVVHAHGHILEENHYYAYGLRIAGISSRKLSPSNDGDARNQYLYNDKELFEDGDLNWYDYGFRNYDPQTGRFLQLDPLSDEFPSYSGYHYAGCDPISNIDWMGLNSVNAITNGASIIDDGQKVHSIGRVWMDVVVVTPKNGIIKTAKTGSGFFRGVGRFLGGVATGIKETVVFTANIVNPNLENNSLVQVGKFVGQVITDPVGTYDAIKQQIKETNWRDPAVYGEFLGGMITPGGAVRAAGYAARIGKTMGKTASKVSQNISRKAAVTTAKESSEKIVKIGCFIAGTLVWTPDGSIPIDSLKEGMSIYAYDTEAQKVTGEKVEQAYGRTVDRLIEVKFEDQKIVTTSEHPFYVRNGWLEAKDLKKGDTLFTTSDQVLVVSQTNVIDTVVQVFNVTVSNQHNYFVGEGRVLVHNNNECSQALNSGTKGAAKTGIEAANGLKITGFTEHGVNRAIGDFSRAGVKPNAILDALKNPLKINNIATDALGRQSQRFIGRFGEVVVNPQTGKIISVNPTSTSKAARLLKQLGQ